MLPLPYRRLTEQEKYVRKFRIDQDPQRFIVITPATIDDYPKLSGMYETFEPKLAAQGLPPAESEVRANWLTEMLEDSFNLLASIEDNTVGHCSLSDIVEGVRTELWIAVHQNWQGLGIGSALMQSVIEAARQCGYNSIWLMVDIKNEKAIHLYRKFGFEFVGPYDLEREMELNLKS